MLFLIFQKFNLFAEIKAINRSVYYFKNIFITIDNFYALLCFDINISTFSTYPNVNSITRNYHFLKSKSDVKKNSFHFKWNKWDIFAYLLQST